jgi:hypothetical protein
MREVPKDAHLLKKICGTRGLFVPQGINREGDPRASLFSTQAHPRLGDTMKTILTNVPTPTLTARLEDGRTAQITVTIEKVFANGQWVTVTGEPCPSPEGD